MNLLLFNIGERRIADAQNVTVCEHTENEQGNTVNVTGYDIPRGAEYCAFRDVDGDLLFFRIVTRTEDKITKQVTLYGENACYELITERPIIDVRPTNVTAGVAAAYALSGSRWQIGTVSAGTLTASTRWYYQQRMSALADIADKWGVTFKFRIEIAGSRIAGRYVDVMAAVPVWRGKRFEIGKDILAAKYTVDKRNVVTAVIGRGKGEETGDGYSPRLGFGEVEWSIANGDPVDKPLGQEYVEIPAATAQYGVLGTRPLFATKVYADIEDAEELLQATYDDLLTASEPSVSAALTVFDLENMGLPHEAARYGDEVALIADDIRYRTTVTEVKRDYAARGKDTFKMGAPGSSLYTQLASLTRSLAETDMRALAGMAVVRENQSLLQGYIDTMVTRIQSSGTTMYTDESDGSLIFESSTGTRAVKITGSGILIADSKTAGAWNWQTALDGGGIVASMITSGVLQANLIKILGTSRFYWDAGNIIASDPEDENRQIRFGLYDGAHYGIAFTRDGGQTWQTALDFNGLNVRATGVSAVYAQETAPTGTLYTGDLWVRRTLPKTCQDLMAMTCGDAAGYTVNDLINGGEILRVWNGTAWVPVYNDQITRNITSIEQDGHEIKLKASQETVDAQGQAIAEAEAAITVNAQQIELKASQSQVDAQGQAITEAQAAITVNAQQIGLKASQSQVDAQGQAITEAQAAITVNANEIEQRVEADGVISAINQTAEAIKILAAKIKLEGIVTANQYFRINTDGSMEAVNGKFAGTLQGATGTFAGELQAATGMFAGTLSAGGWVFGADGALYAENGAVKFEIDFNDEDGATVASDLSKRLALIGRELYFFNVATTGAVILGQDSDAGYTQQCFYPTQTRTGNLGTPSHIWDTASIRAIFRETEGGLSSRKVKKKIRNLKGVSTIIDALNPVTFIYRDDPRNREHYGLIYEDTEPVAPLLCVQLQDNDDSPRNKGIDYSNLSVLLLKEVQDLRARVAALENRR